MLRKNLLSPVYLVAVKKYCLKPALTRIARSLLVPCVAFALQTAIGQDVANYRSGISIGYSGVSGRDYIEEYFYHDAKVTDRRVVYINSSTLIEFSHNPQNIFGRDDENPIGVNGRDGVPNSGDEGLIRYRVDRDLNYGRRWASATGAVHSEYSAPFSFDQLFYEPGMPVVGGIGPRPGYSITDKNNYYVRGLTDEFGDEWHTISFADDDRLARRAENVDASWWASDGKTISFVVNPKTPAIRVLATGNAQFYTTPPKAYFVPKIHSQTTYYSERGGTVSIEIRSLSAEPVSYRVNGGEWIVSTNPSVQIQSSAFNLGVNKLEYFHGSVGNKIKARTIVREPTFPSAAESHGNALWQNEEGFNAVKARMGRMPYSGVYTNLGTATGAGQNDWDKLGMRGNRHGGSLALNNAFHARIKGWDSKASGKSKTYASYAKEMIIDSIRHIDPVGFELNHSSDAIPAREIHYRGYWDIVPILRNAYAYDILIGGYRSDLHPGGITPIEDFMIRDTFASVVLECLQWLGGWNGMEPGMWGISRNVGGLVIALVMPSYNTPYYGVSGFDGRTSSVNWTPYPDMSPTWKQVLLDNSVSLRGYPNLQFNSGLREGQITLFTSTGVWKDKVSYTSYSLTGQHLETLANILASQGTQRFPSLEKFFELCATGELTGLKDSPVYTRRLPVLTVVNSSYPGIVSRVNNWIGGLPTTDPNSVSKSLSEAGVLGLVWYDDNAVGDQVSLPYSPSNLVVTPAK